MSRKNLMIMFASLLLVLGVLLAPGSFSSTAHANSKVSNLPQDPPRICPPTSANGDSDSGSSGSVHKLQKDLNSWYDWYKGKDGVAYYQKQHAEHPDFSKVFPLTVDGKFGPLTEQAVKDFQGVHKDKNGTKLAQDGVVGPLTWGALGECDGTTSASKTSTGSQTSSKPVRGDACLGSVGCGSATFTFTGKNQLTNISMNVKDTVCETPNETVYIALRIYYDGGHTKDVLRNETKSPCNSSVAKQYSQYAFSETDKNGNYFPIDGVRVRVCSNVAYNTDTCVPNGDKSGQTKYIDNPNV